MTLSRLTFYTVTTLKINDMYDTWSVIEARFLWSTYFEPWFRGSKEEAEAVQAQLQREHPDKIFVLVQR